MDHIKKCLICLLIFLIFVYCVVFDYPSYSRDIRVESEVIQHVQKNDSETDRTEKDAEKATEGELEEKEQSEVSDEEKLQEIEETLKQLYKYAPSNAYIGIEYINSSVYDYLYPVLRDAGYAGVMVLRNGVLPGDERRITVEQCQKLLDAGWNFAVGANYDIDLTTYTEETALEWGAYLQEYSAEIKEKIGAAPNMYCFDEGEYHQEFDRILAENGYNVILYYDDSAEDVIVMNNMVKINCVRITAQTAGEELVSAVKGFHNVLTMVHFTESSPSDDLIKDFAGQYKDLLTSLGESGSIEIHSIGELESILLKTPENISKTYARISQLEQEREELLKKLGSN